MKKNPSKNKPTFRRRLSVAAILLVFLSTALAVNGVARSRSGTVDPAGEVSRGNVFAAGAFENPDRCMRCHRDIYNAWSGSKHRFAWEDSFYQPDYLKAGLETEGFTDVFCGECHAPVARRTGQLPPRDGSRFDEISKKGISCDYCHTVKEIIEPVNIDTVSDPGRTKRGPRGDGRSGAHVVLHSKIHTDAAFCGACHNVVHPTTGVVIIDTYDDWKKGPYAAEGIRCQDCHMTPGPGVEKNPGRSGIGGKERDSVATHYFPGGSVFFQDLAGNEAQAQMARQMLKAAAEIQAEAARNGDGIDLAVRVHNVGAGHKIPTGVTYIRKIWLEITASDESGNIFFRSGHVAADNHVDPSTAFYRLIFRDAEGNPTPKSWLAHGIAYDRRIPARGYDEQRFTIPVEPGAGACRILVRLLYRSMSQEAADGMGTGEIDVPSIEMARFESVIP